MNTLYTEDFIKKSNGGMFDDDHPTVSQISNEGIKVDVDIIIADTINTLWKNNINTCFSCQGGDEGNKKIQEYAKTIGIDIACHISNGYISFPRKTDIIRYFTCFPKSIPLVEIDVLHDGDISVLSFDQLVNF